MVQQKIFFGGVPKSVPRKRIISHFEKFGTVIEFTLDQSEKSRYANPNRAAKKPSKDLHRGCGYVTMAQSESYFSILKGEHIIAGIQFDCKKALSKEEKYKQDIKIVEERRKVIVQNIGKNVNKSHLKAYFNQFGEVEEVSYISKPDNSGYAFITFLEPYKGLELIELPLPIDSDTVLRAEFSTKGLKNKDRQMLKKEIENYLEKSPKLKISSAIRKKSTHMNTFPENLKIRVLESDLAENLRLKNMKKLIRKSLECFMD